MPNYPWFRVYSNDILSDRKLARICQVCNVSRALVRGVWLTLMAMANDSPVRGVLLIAVGLPVTEDEIRADLGLDDETFEAIMSELVALRMIERGEQVILLNFVKRNPPSDSSTERVRRHREREQQPARNVTEALPEQSGNAIESEGESESDPESEGEGEAHAQELRGMPAPAAVVVFYEVTKRKVPNKHWGDQIAQTVGTEPAVLDRWRATINGWLGAGYSRTNVAGMLDWFREERTERGRDNGTGKQRATKGEPPPVIDGWTDFEEPAAPIPKHADAG